jgi:hypothetical protein
MKIILPLFFTLFVINLSAQTPLYIHVNFDNPNFFGLSAEIDTSNIDNIWQIGQPYKIVLNQAESQPNVIITDTLNTYPINNSSSFYISYYDYNCGYMDVSYFCDTDSLNDYGTIELSMDSGQTWINILDDSLNIIANKKPILTGNSSGWQWFSFFYGNLLSDFGDSILFKFSFTSDSIDTQHDGLMFDNLAFCESVNTQNRYQLNNLKVFPNPATDILNFELEEPIQDAQIRIYSILGQLVEQKNMDYSEQIQFNVSTWNSGMYFYGIYIEGRLVKQGQVLIQN